MRHGALDRLALLFALLGAVLATRCGSDDGPAPTDVELDTPPPDDPSDDPPDDAVDAEDSDGDNAAPTVRWIAPADGASFAHGASVRLEAIVADDHDASGDLAVAWSSPIQGVIDAAGAPVAAPGDDGVVSLTTDTLVLGAHRVTLSVTDSEGATTSAVLTVHIAPADGAPTLAIDPAAPRTADALVARVVDPGAAGRPFTTTWSWFRGAEAVDVAGDTVPAELTARGETWRVEGVAVGNGVTTPIGVAQVDIGNSAPACARGAALTVDAQGVACRCDGRADADDGDAIADRCAWTVDGDAVASVDGCRLNDVAAGSAVGCTLVPTDGVDDGAAVSATVIVPDAHGNTPPSAPVVAVHPRFGAADDAFTCEIEAPAVDAQGDVVSYRVAWAVGDRWGADGDRWSVVPAADLTGAAGGAADGETLRCRVVATDGVLDAAPAVSEPVVLGAVGLELGDALGDVALTEDLGNGCWKGADHALPGCVADLLCAVDVTACFDAAGERSDAPIVVEGAVGLPGFGDVAVRGEVADDGSFCVSGAAPDVAPPTFPLPMTDVVVTICSDAEGHATRTLAGVVTVDGARYPFSGAAITLTSAALPAAAGLPGAPGFDGLTLSVPMPAVRLDGTTVRGTLTWGTVSREVGLVGEVVLDDVGALAVDGAFETEGGALVRGRLALGAAGAGVTVAGVTFAGASSIALEDGAWTLALAGGSIALPGDDVLNFGGEVGLVAGRLEHARFAAGSGASFAGWAFSGEAAVTLQDGRFGLELGGGALGDVADGGVQVTLAGAVAIEDGAVVAGELSAGADLTLAGIGFTGAAAVTWEEGADGDVVDVALGGGLVGLPEGAGIGLAGTVRLKDGALDEATFAGSGIATLAGVTFGGNIDARWGGGRSWSLGLSDGQVVLPGGDALRLAGTLAVVEGRVASGSFAVDVAGSELAFLGVRFAAQASAGYTASWDDAGNLVGQELTLGLSGGRLQIEGAADSDGGAGAAHTLDLAGEVSIADGAVRSASFSAGTGVTIGGVTFAGRTAVDYDAGDARLALSVAGGQLEVAGSTLTFGGAIAIDTTAGAARLTCGELEAASAVQTSLGGLTFDLGVRFAAAGATCTWADGTAITATTSQFLAALKNGALTVAGVQANLDGFATIDGGHLACASFGARGGATVPIGGVSFGIGARYAAVGALCPWSADAAVAGTLELTLNEGVVAIGDQRVSLSGAAVVSGGEIVSAHLASRVALTLPGLEHGFEVAAAYERATGLELALASGEVEIGDATFALSGHATVASGQVGCIALAARGAAGTSTATIAQASLEVGARFSAQGFQCAWQDAPAAADRVEVTLAGDIAIGAATHTFSGVGQVVDGRLACAELTAAGALAFDVGGASFKGGLRYAAAGATCAWADGTETTADAPTLLASLRDGQLEVGGVRMTLAGTGELQDGALTCVELEASGAATFDVAGASFKAGARFAAQGATCPWTDGPAAADTLEATLHDGAIAVGDAHLVMSGAAEIVDGRVHCAALHLDGGGDLAFGGLAFKGSGRFIAAGATCDGESAARDTLRLTLDDGVVDVAGTPITLHGEGEVAAGHVRCITFEASAASAVPLLGGVEVQVSGLYAADGETCPGESAPALGDTFGLVLALQGESFNLRGLGRVEGGALACAELDAAADATALAGIAFDVGGRFTANGHACTWRDGTTTTADAGDVFVATLRNGTLAVGDANLSLAGEGTLVAGALTCASLVAEGAAPIDLGGVSFSAGARYAAAGSDCGWSDGAAERLALTLHDGAVTVGGNELRLSGTADLAGRKLTCATLAAAATIDVGGVSFAIGARYAAAGSDCGWSDGASNRFELTLRDGAVTVAGNTFTLAGGARLDGGAIACAELTSSGRLALGGTTFTVGGRFTAAGKACTWADGTTTTAAASTLALTLADGHITIAGQDLRLAGGAVVRHGTLACAELAASADLDFDVGGVRFGLGGARWTAAGETCEWADGSRSTAAADTFAVALEDGELAVGTARLVLSGTAELSGASVTCAELHAGGSASGATTLAVGGVTFTAGARFAAAGHDCGWSDGAANTLEVTLDDGRVEVGDAALELDGAAAIAGGKLTCADFTVTGAGGAAPEVAFSGVSFTAGARFAAAGSDCGWSDGAANHLELRLDEGRVDVGGASVSLSGSAEVVDGALGCAVLVSDAAVPVGGLAFTVSGRFAAAGHTCPWAASPAVANTFELGLDQGRLDFGAGTLSLSGRGTVVGGKLTCAELVSEGRGAAARDSAAAGNANTNAEVAGINFDLGARYVAAGETCTFADGSELVGTTSVLQLALKNGHLDVGGQTLTLSGLATIQDRTVACATLDATGQGQIDLGGVSFAAGARFTAAGRRCALPDGSLAPAPTDDTLVLTLADGHAQLGPAAVTFAGTAQIADRRLTCADLAVDGGAAIDLGGVSARAHARYAAAGESCGFSDGGAAHFEALLDDARVSVGATALTLSGRGELVGGRLTCASFAANGAAPLGGLRFDVGGRFAAAGATCAPDTEPAAANTFELTLGGASVAIDGVGRVDLAGSGQVVGGALTCAELASSGTVDVGGVTFDLGARYAKAGATCTWADGSALTPAANTFSFALLHGALDVGPTHLALSGAATLVGGALTCGDLDATGDAAIDIGGVRFAAGARYLAAGATCRWRDGSTTTATQRTFQLALHDGHVEAGGAQLALTGTGDIVGGRLACATFDAAGNTTGNTAPGAPDLALGGVSFDAGARYAAAGETCGWSDGAAATLELTLRNGALDVGGVSAQLAGDASIVGGAVTCATLASSAAVGLAGTSFQLGARYARANATCPDMGAATPTARFEATLAHGRLALGGVTLDLAGHAAVAGARLTCAELAAVGSSTIDLGGVAFDVGARYARGGETCTWSDGTIDSPAVSTLSAALHGSLPIGGSTLTLRGSGTIAGGAVVCAELAGSRSAAFEPGANTDVSLGGVTFDAGARFSAANRACTWSDGTTTPAPATPTLALTLARGEVQVAGTTVTLTGSARLERTTGIACADFTVAGAVAIAGVTFDAGAHYAAADTDCGAWDTTHAARFELALAHGSVDLGGSQVSVAGALAIENHRVTHGALAATGQVALAGLTFSPQPGPGPAQPVAAFTYDATYAPSGASQSLRASLAGRVAIDGLGTFDLSGGGAIVDRKLDDATFHLGTSLTLAGATITDASVDLLYRRVDPDAAGASTLVLALDSGEVAIAGLGTLAVGGRTRLVAGRLDTLTLRISGAIALAGAELSGGAALVYSGPTRSLELTVDRATLTVAGLGELTVTGRAAILGAALDALDLAVSGALSVSGVTLSGAASLAFRRNAPGNPTLRLALDRGTAHLDPLGDLAVTGALALEGGRLASFALAITTNVVLANVPLSGGASLTYDAATRELAFAVTDAGVNVPGLGRARVDGRTIVRAGRLASIALALRGDVALSGVTLTGAMSFLYDAAGPSIAFVVDDASATIAGLDAALHLSGRAALDHGRLTSLDLAVAAGASFQGVALEGAAHLAYSATLGGGGMITSRSLALVVDRARVALPGATVDLGGSLAIADGRVTCAALGPADVSLTGITLSASASYVATGETCGQLATPAVGATFTAALASQIDVVGHALAITGSAAIAAGRVDAITFTGTLDLGGLPGLGGLRSATVAGDYRGGTACLSGAIDGTVALPLDVELHALTAGLCITGPRLASVDVDLDLTAPNLVGDPAHLLATAHWDGEATTLSAGLCLAAQPTADPDPNAAPNPGPTTDTACCAGAPGCGAATWHPFDAAKLPGLPGDWSQLVVSALGGQLSIGAGGLAIDGHGAIDASALPPLVPGLTLKQLEVELALEVGQTFAAAAGVRGTFTLPLGETPVDVGVHGRFALGGHEGLALELGGTVGDKASGVSADIEPLRQFIGQDTFEISYLEVELAASATRGVSFTLGGGANVSLPAPVSFGPLGLQLEGHGELGARSGFYLTGAVCGIPIPASILPPGFDAIDLGGPSPCANPAVAVALASRNFPDVELAPNTPIRRGLTLAATIRPPAGALAPLGLDETKFAALTGMSSGAAAPSAARAPLAAAPSFPSIVAEIGLDPSGLRLKGALNLPWQVIRPDWNLPAVKLLRLDQLAFQITLSSAPTLSFSGSAVFEPAHCLPDYQSFVEAGLASDDSPFKAFDPARIRCLDLPPPFADLPQQEPLRGVASFRYRPPKEFGGEIYFTGLWYEPFWLPNLGIANPGISLDIRLVDGPYGVQIPVPTSFGVNGDVFWKRPYYDGAAAHPSFPVACVRDADCTGYGDCRNGACPAACVDGPDGDSLPDTCRYTWPYTCAAPDPDQPDAACIDTLQQPADVPASLAHRGLSLFYDVYPSPSALVIPLPTLIARTELDHLDTLDLVPALDDLKDGMRNLLRWMDDHVPGVTPALSPFPPCVDLDGDHQLDKSLSCMFPATPLPNLLKDLPFSLELDRARLYLSTHQREVFGVTFAPGIRADLDAKLTELGAPTCDPLHPCSGGTTCDDGTCKRTLELSGALGREGLSLSGRASPIDLLDVLTIKGDPFTKVAALDGGAIVVDDDPALEALPGTVEAWVREDAGPGTWQSVLSHVDAAGNGYRLLVGDAALHCVANEDQCDTGQCANWQCEGRGGLMPSAPCAEGGVPGICTTCPPAPDGANATPCDVPCTSDAECAAVPGATCYGAIPWHPDASILDRVRRAPDVDLESLIAQSATDCAGDMTCTAGALTSSITDLVGAGRDATLSPSCATCLAGFTACAERASLRLDELAAGNITRSVTTSTPLVASDTWTHVAVAFDADDVALYVDGKRALADSTEAPAGPPAGGVPHPTIGAGATFVMGAVPGPGVPPSVPGLDDVRLWTTRKSDDQIDANRTGLPQDATPESPRWAFDPALVARWEFDYDSYQSALGRAWNTRYRGAPDTDADGDPDGTDCVATSTLPPAGICQLVGAPCRDYERDASYKLHGRYVGGAHWATSIDIAGAAAADDLFFSARLPFDSSITSDAGLSLRGGASLHLPTWLPAPEALTNGGVRVDVSTQDGVHGELYAKPFDLLGLGVCAATTQRCTTNADCDDPVLGLDDLAFCRDDGYCTAGPCLGQLTLSGYGENGVDDGIDDGFYARAAFAQPLPTLAAGARLSVQTFDAPRSDLAFTSYDLQCPPGQTCASAGDYRLSTASGLQLHLPLPIPAADGHELVSEGRGAAARELLTVCGRAASYKPGKGDSLPDWLVAASAACPGEGNAPAWGTFVDGTVDVLSQRLEGSAILTSCGFEIHSGFDLGKVSLGDFQLPSLGVLQTDVTGRWVPFRVCARSALDLALSLPEGAPLKLLELDAAVTAEACIGEATKYPDRDSGQFLRLQTGGPLAPPSDATLRFFALDGGPSLFEMNGLLDLCVGDGDEIGVPGDMACDDNHLRVCGDLSLLGGLVHVDDKCLELHVPHADVVFSMHQAVNLDFAGVLPSSQSEIFIEMCPKGQVAAWSDAEDKVVCNPHANPAFKMSAPMVRLRFKADLDLAGGSFGNVDVNLVADWANGLRFAGSARYTSGESTAFGYDNWAPDFCEISVALVVPIGGLPHLEGGSPRCSPYCLVDTDCVTAGATCQLGKCLVCGDDTCSFGENSLTCPQDCGYPAGATCPGNDDSYCASNNCWSITEQLPFLKDPNIEPRGVCLPCLPGVTDCGPGKYCDGFQFFECRDRAEHGTYCAMNEACQSNKCQFDLLWGGPRCAECTAADQCAPGQWCDTYPSLVPSAPNYRCHDKALTGEKCGVGPFIGATDGNCAAGNFCDVDGTCHIKVANDYVCTGDRVCTSGHCCYEGIGICEECCADADCGGGLRCYDHTCRLGHDGELCNENEDCNSGHCVVGICTTPVPNGSVCGANDACQSGHCCYAGVVGVCGECCDKSHCGNPEEGCYGYDCRPGNKGEPCSTSQECASDDCSAGLCLGGAGDFCGSAIECAWGLGCYGNTCRKGNNGEGCNPARNECASGYCSAPVFGTCQNPP